MSADVRLHQLEGFYYVGIEGGYARAAAAMPYAITEPAVYQQVRKLERALGVPLVEQAKPRRTVLTPQGRRLHEFVAPFFKTLPLVVEEVRRGEGARLAIAVEGTLARDIIIDAISALRAKRPRLEVHLAERKVHEVAALVRSGDADLGLGTLGVSGAGVKEEPLFQVKIALCVPAGHALAKRRAPPEPRELDGLPICAYERGNPGREILETAFKQAGLSLSIAAEGSSFETLRALVAAGVGPAFVPVLEHARSRGTVRRANGVVVFDVTGLLPGEPVRYGLITRALGPRHAALRDLEILLRAATPVLGGAPPPRVPPASRLP